MRLIAVGDIHGCSRALDVLLAAVRLTAVDRLVALGDYVDRGPDSNAVLDRLIQLHRTGRLIPLRGNHELMMLRARMSPIEEKHWRYFGGDKTLASYADNLWPQLRHVPKVHWDFLENELIDWFETDSHVFVHAGVDPARPLDQQSEEMLQWAAFTDRGPHYSGKIVVCGHTEQHHGLPLNVGHAVCIDTWAYGGGWLTALDVNSGEVWQADQAGQTRTAHIDDFLIERVES